MAFWVHTGWQAVIAFGLIIGLGAAAGGSLPAQAAITNWFVKKRSLALSIKYAAGGLGGFFAVPLLNWLITRAGGSWRVAWWLLAALAAGAAVISAIFVKGHPSEVGQFADGAAANLSTPVGPHPRARLGVYQTAEQWTFSEALRTRALWLLILANLGVSMGIAMFTAHGVVHLKDVGYTSAAAAMSISVLADRDADRQDGGRLRRPHRAEVPLGRLHAALRFGIDLGLSRQERCRPVSVCSIARVGKRFEHGMHDDHTCQLLWNQGVSVHHRSGDGSGQPVRPLLP